jgi:Fe-S-cluster containining protein
VKSEGGREWFNATDPTGTGPGLRFRCTQCGNCCTGPEGYVLYTAQEGAAIAARLGMTFEEFERTCTKETVRGRSLAERATPHGLDCIFLERRSVPGRAVCGIYEDRPMQCRTWPFWKSVVRSEQSWAVASRSCPGINKGPLTPPQQVRVLRDRVEM